MLPFPFSQRRPLRLGLPLLDFEEDRRGSYGYFQIGTMGFFLTGALMLIRTCGFIVRVYREHGWEKQELGSGAQIQYALEMVRSSWVKALLRLAPE